MFNMFILLILAGAFACEGRRTFFSHFNKSKNFSRCRKDPTRIYTYMATDRIFIMNLVSCWYVGVLVVKSAFLENEKNFLRTQTSTHVYTYMAIIRIFILNRYILH